jgi:hypothetical protein
MYSTLLTLHSALRYFVLLFLMIVIVRSMMGWQKKDGYTAGDDKLSLWLFMLTHTQLLVGLVLCPFVVFSGTSMKDSMLRYWLVEHNTMMLIAIVLITMARITAKKIADGAAKHKRLFIFNTIALIIILAAISMSGRGFFSLPV